MTHQEIAQPERLLRMPEVEQACGLKRSSIYRGIDAGTFPQPVRLGPRAVGFSASQIQQWIADRISGKPTTDRQWIAKPDGGKSSAGQQ